MSQADPKNQQRTKEKRIAHARRGPQTPQKYPNTNHTQQTPVLSHTERAYSALTDTDEQILHPTHKRAQKSRTRATTQTAQTTDNPTQPDSLNRTRLFLLPLQKRSPCVYYIKFSLT